MLLLFQFINSAFSDYNKDQFTPVKLEGTDEQVSRGNHKDNIISISIILLSMLLPKKIFWKPFGLQKEKKKAAALSFSLHKSWSKRV